MRIDEFGRFHKFYYDQQVFINTWLSNDETRITFNDSPTATLFASFLLSPSQVLRHRCDTNLIASNENLMPSEIPTVHFSIYLTGSEFVRDDTDGKACNLCEVRALDWIYTVLLFHL